MGKTVTRAELVRCLRNTKEIVNLVLPAGDVADSDMYEPDRLDLRRIAFSQILAEYLNNDIE